MGSRNSLNTTVYGYSSGQLCDFSALSRSPERYTQATGTWRKRNNYCRMLRLSSSQQPCWSGLTTPQNHVVVISARCVLTSLIKEDVVATTGDAQTQVAATEVLAKHVLSTATVVRALKTIYGKTGGIGQHRDIATGEEFCRQILSMFVDVAELIGKAARHVFP
jgi:hypothetical protein